MRVPVGDEKFFFQLASSLLLFLALLVLHPLGLLALEEGIDLVALQQRGDDHREDYEPYYGCVDLLRPAIDEEQQQQPKHARHQCGLPPDPLPITRRARQAQSARQSGHWAPGFHHRRKVREIGLDVGFDPLSVALLRIVQVDGQTQGQAIAVNPHLRLASHRPELVGSI